MHCPRRLIGLALALLACLVAAGCSVSTRQAGVANFWRVDGALDDMKPGVTTMDNIFDTLGPPSQIVELRRGALLYYLLERTESDALYLAVFNTETVRVKYDRAVFLCDDNGILKHMSVSHEKVPLDETKKEAEEQSQS